MSNDINFSNIPRFNINESNIDNQLLDNITSSFETSYFEPQFNITMEYPALIQLSLGIPEGRSDIS